MEQLLAGSRIDMGEKRLATDFALWKFSPTDQQRQMEWDSPWGRGFPGWHIECSAMAMHHLGETLDIHCGGTDHVRVHHTNEIAQSEAATGKPFSRFWMHGEFLRTNNDKMSKSSGEFLTLSLLVEMGYNPLDYRYLALGSHYRTYLNFTFEALDTAQSALKALDRRVRPLVAASGMGELGGTEAAGSSGAADSSPEASARAGVLDAEKLAAKLAGLSDAAQAWRTKFRDAVGDDLNIPAALGILHSMARDTDLAESERGLLVLDFDRVLGLDLHKPYVEFKPTGAHAKAVAESLADDEIIRMIEERNAARKARDFARSDAVRDKLLALGIALKDGPQGTVWERT